MVEEVFAANQDGFPAAGERLTAALAQEAQQVEAIAHRIASQTGWTYEGIDLTPVPLKDISIGAAIESLLEKQMGSAGSLSAPSTGTSPLRRVAADKPRQSALMIPCLVTSHLPKPRQPPAPP